MDIMELEAMGERVGGVAVIASLLFVGFQVRQPNPLNHPESVRAYVRGYSTVLGELRDNECTAWMQRASREFNGLPRNEQIRVHGWLLPHTKGA